jgi:hypothetical protein
LNLPLSLIDFCRAATIIFVLSASTSLAQTDNNLPPVAAPTSRVQVQSIAVVRSPSEQADDFIAGLLRGLSTNDRVQGVAIAAMQADHVVVERNWGALTDTTQFSAGQLRGLLPPASHTTRNATTSVSDLLHIAAALANSGGVAGLAQMHRNGWTAFQLDSVANDDSVRLVIAPQAKLAYVIAIRGRPDWRIWRSVDDAVFDELLPPQMPVALTGDTASELKPPVMLTGTYEPERSVSFLKLPGRALQVRAAGTGAVQLSGAESATLISGPGIWKTPDGSLTATVQKDELLLSSGAAYRLVPLYRRAGLYVLLLLLVLLTTFGVMLRRAI